MSLPNNNSNNNSNHHNSPTNMQKELETLCELRDVKRERMQELFRQKLAILNQMSSLEKELILLDKEIDTLEERQLRANALVTTTTTMAATNEPSLQPQQKQQQRQASLSPPPSPPPMTMNPEEILTEPFTLTMTDNRHNRSDNDEEEEEEEEARFDSMNGYNDENDHREQNVARKLPSTAPGRVPTTTTTNAAKLPSLLWKQMESSSSSTNSANQATAKKRRRTELIASASSSSSCPFTTQQITHVLQQKFRIHSFRENQLEIIQTTLSGRDCFVNMRTGGGKSLTYQLPALLELNNNTANTPKKVTVVVSPLLSLIQDQEDQTNSFQPGSCVSFTSGIGTTQHAQNWQRVRDPNGGVGMILVTPEKVYKSNKLRFELQKLFQQGRIGRFVVDECHCACQWGHDFRPDYAKLGVLKNHFPSVPILAVTATASDRVREDCCSILQLDNNYRFFRSTANRPNLRYQVRPKESATGVLEDMAAFIKEHHPRAAGIIYTYSRKDADTVADQLVERGIFAEAYHSDISAARKHNVHRSWMRNETQVVVATIAFGLGINKPDVRFVLHHTLSKTLEAYYQESGRAGRDGNPADCVLYYSPKDVPRMIRMTHGESSETLFWTMVRYVSFSSIDDFYCLLYFCTRILLVDFFCPAMQVCATVWERSNLQSHYFAEFGRTTTESPTDDCKCFGGYCPYRIQRRPIPCPDSFAIVVFETRRQRHSIHAGERMAGQTSDCTRMRPKQSTRKRPLRYRLRTDYRVFTRRTADCCQCPVDCIRRCCLFEMYQQS